MELEKLLELYPSLYHMAERGTWDSIKRRGLLSASAALDLFCISGSLRTSLESEHRSEMRDIVPARLDSIVLRDQKPMPPSRLRRALTDGTTTDQWYRLINSKVFFWAEKARLLRLLNARDYKNREHDVLTISTRSLLASHHSDVFLCHMNSGNTWPLPHRRGIHIFKRIHEYPAKRNGKPEKNVVEIVVDYKVPNIADHVVEVNRMRGSNVLGPIWVPG